jgi:signal transduction histidine kinase
VAGLAVSRRVCSLLEPDFSEAGVDLVCVGQDLALVADPEQFEQVLVNLLLNSLRASPTGTRVTVTLARDGGHGRLTVTDRGTGIDPGLREDIFKPYVTGRSDGHGLGLAIVKRIVESHGWTVELDSPADPQGNGTTATISRIALAEEGNNREEAE